MKRATTLILAFLVTLPFDGLADVGSVSSWSSNTLNELTFTCTTANVKLEFLDANVVRVRMEPNGTAFNTNTSLTVIKNWVRPAISVVDGSAMTVTTPGLRVDVQKTPFRLAFR